jgi:hypothetical protein
VRVAAQLETPFDGRTASFSQTFSSPAWDRPAVSRSTLRFLDADTLASFLGEADLVIEEQFGNWDRQRLTPASPEIITIARRK